MVFLTKRSMPNVPPTSQARTLSAKFEIDERRGTVAGRKARPCAQLAKVNGRTYLQES